MGRKRQPFSFPELEGRGRRAILRTADEVQAEEELLSAQGEDQERQQTSLPANQLASKQSTYQKVTYRLRPATIDAAADAKRLLRRRYNLKVSLEEIADQAIQAACQDLLENQDASMLVRQLSILDNAQKGGDST